MSEPVHILQAPCGRLSKRRGCVVTDWAKNVTCGACLALLRPASALLRLERAAALVLRCDEEARTHGTDQARLDRGREQLRLACLIARMSLRSSPPPESRPDADPFAGRKPVELDRIIGGLPDEGAEPTPRGRLEGSLVGQITQAGMVQEPTPADSIEALIAVFCRDDRDGIHTLGAPSMRTLIRHFLREGQENDALVEALRELLGAVDAAIYEGVIQHPDEAWRAEVWGRRIDYAATKARALAGVPPPESRA